MTKSLIKLKIAQVSGSGLIKTPEPFIVGVWFGAISMLT